MAKHSEISVAQCEPCCRVCLHSDGRIVLQTEDLDTRLFVSWLPLQCSFVREKLIVKCVLSQEQSVILCLCVACRHRTGRRITWPESLYAAQLMHLSHTFRQYVLVSSEVACNKDFNMHDSYWLLVVLNVLSCLDSKLQPLQQWTVLCSESKLNLNIDSNLLPH